MNEKIDNEINSGLENIGDMFESCAVRGEQFMSVAIASFKAGSVVEIYTFACSAHGKDSQEGSAFDRLGTYMSELLSSIISKIGVGMDEKSFGEAVAFGVKVHEQKMAMQNRVQNLINKQL